MKSVAYQTGYATAHRDLAELLREIGSQHEQALEDVEDADEQSRLAVAAYIAYDLASVIIARAEKLIKDEE